MVSRRALRIAMLVLTVVGLGLASYLTYVHYSGIKPACSLGGSCEKVQTSAYSHLAGVPVALMGLIGYVSILILLLAPENETTRFATVAVTIVGFGFSAYLTYRELFSIHAICEWCVSSAVVMTVLVILAVWRFLLGDELPSGGRGAAEDGRSDSPSSLGAISS
ncbi:MAG TPA: vitamin K epoxide reductase family protein [Solirubrobacteraceae bacterium]|nr:vitamin K epoxide reductase family protein [Solirubrobacteraceae bacterium]